MPEFQHIVEGRIELIENPFEPRFRVVERRRALEKKTAHVTAEDFGDRVKLTNQPFGANEPFLVRNQLVYFDAKAEVVSGEPAPGFHRCRLRPAIKWGIELDGVESAAIKLKPLGGWQIGWIEAVFPMPIKPARTTDAQFHPFSGSHAGAIFCSRIIFKRLFQNEVGFCARRVTRRSGESRV